MFFKRVLYTLLLPVFFCAALKAQVQPNTPQNPNITDSVKPGYVDRMHAFAKQLSAQSASDLEADKAIIIQDKAFADIKKSMQKAGLYLKGVIDTTGASKHLSEIEQDFITASDGVLVNRGSAQTFRNLTATSKIITELLNKTLAIRNVLDVHHQNLSNFRFELDSISNKPELFKFPDDSVSTNNYLQHLRVMAHQIHPVDSALKQTGDNVRTLLNRVDMTVLKLQTALEEVQFYQKSMALNSLKREFGNIWEAVGYARPFNEIIIQARDKGMLTLVFYLQNNSGTFVLFILLIIISFIYLRSLKSIYVERGLLDQQYNGQLVIKRPLLSAFIIIINVFQFLFFSPPFLLSFIFWVVTSISLSILFSGFITRYWMKVWLTMLGLFGLSALDNLVLQATRSERWFMLVLSIVGTLVGALVYAKGRKDELREKWIVYSIALMAVLEFGSFAANAFGRYNLSKSLLIGGFLNVVVAILFLWTARLINEGLYLAFNVYTKQSRKLFFLNFEKVGTRAPLLFYVALVFGWLVLLGRNFAGFEYIAGPLRDVFSSERTLGNYTFTINRLLLFVVIMGVSVMVSKIVSFFASDDHLSGNKNDSKKRGIGSWLLLVRISILSIGLFLAIAAAGIPLDRITIVLGALGVGIGFGLQTLVNNLVSGLIIAFEKPVNVGDVVEIGGQGGTMKSIGFRSSVITTWEGADVVMPNGDLLSAHLTNWTLGGNRKRMSILIGIAYDADLQKARSILTDTLNKDERISRNPGPIVQYEQFNSSSIDIRVYFWTVHMSDSFSTRSDLIMTITSAFAQNGINIPFPHQELHLHLPKDGNNPQK